MSMIDYSISPLRLIDNPAFPEASKEELRVLLALIELGGRCESESALAKATGISCARCKSALAFWVESGVIYERALGEPTIVNEFEDRLVRGEIDEVPATMVAESIRNENLASMIDECALLMGQACLPNADVKRLAALYTQYSLSPEYVVTLAAHLAGKNTLTVRKLCNEAIRLSGAGCDSVEALENYIQNKEESLGAEWEFRRLLGIYGRSLSESEKKYFKKWSVEFGYSTAVVSQAYDIAILNTKNGRGDLRYMDSILTSWHDAGCKTVSECLEKVESDKMKKASAADTSSKSSRRSKTTADTPRYGEFDINEAFEKALSRSYDED